MKWAWRSVVDRTLTALHGRAGGLDVATKTNPQFKEYLDSVAAVIVLYCRWRGDAIDLG